MAATLSHRRPGVRFEVAQSRRPSTLPRLDVAGFVGFAAAGPVDVPVPVESVARHRELFGPDLVLARDEAGEAVHAQLGPAVESFFANGGKKVWVVRVAERGPAGAVRVRFALPGLYDDAGGTAAHAWCVAVARSEGAWAEELTAGAREEVLRLGGAIDPVRLTVPADRVVVGDLVRARVGPRRFAFFEVAAVRERVATLVDLQRAFEAFVPPLVPALPPIVCEGVSIVPRAMRVRADGGLHLELDAEAWPAVGALLEIDGGFATVTAAAPAPSDAAAPWAVETTAVLRETTPLALTGSPPPDLTWERVRLELVVHRNGQLYAKLGGLGFRARHPLAWSRLPDDHALFAPRSQSWVPPVDGALAALVDAPRFPLAAGAPLIPGAPRDALPLGMPGTDDALVLRAVIRDPRPREARDGLARFAARAFLDPALEPSRAYTLRETIEARAYTARTPEPPLGLFALWPVEEVVLVAAPDAAHRAWSPETPDPAPSLPAPVLSLAPGPTLQLEWTAVALLGAASADAPSYRLEVADHADQEPRLVVQRGADRTHRIEADEACRGLRYYRVRAELGSLTSPWSNEVSLRPAGLDFDPCASPTLTAPLLTILLGSPADPHLTWIAAPGTHYRLEVSTEPELAAADVLFEGTAANPVAIPVPSASAGRLWFRLRAREGDTVGPWSSIVAFDGPAPPVELRLESPGRYALSGPSGPATVDSLLAVQRALLRFAAARADVVAILSLPRHYGEREAGEHRAQLLGGTAGSGLVPPPTDAEASTLAPYGALYHPWLRLEGGRVVVPDGAIGGMIAARTIARGAWVAPANVPLAGVVGLTTPLDDHFATAALDLGLNTVVQLPRGFLPLASRTLAPGTELAELSVVRLGALIRRIVERDAPRYTFEPHDTQLGRRVKDDLEELLARMWRLGAFRGASSAEAFQVITDDRVNRGPERDRGRFFVELRYAPSLPLEFLTVRLVESPRGGLRAEGVLP